MDAADLANRFTYHPPKDGQPVRYQRIRDAAGTLALLLNGECPDSREKSLAGLSTTTGAVTWANAAIARNE